MKSRFDPATFASHPEMDAYNVTDELLKRLEKNPYGFIVVNYANCDMVGHTGDEKAATKAVEVTDECIGKILPRLLELDAHVLIFADHGNAEQMVDYKSGLTKTSHTLNFAHAEPRRLLLCRERRCWRAPHPACEALGRRADGAPDAWAADPV